MKLVRTVAMLATAVACLLQAQAAVTPPNAKARVFGVSPNLVSKNIPGIDRPSNGLPNVGKGTKVYLYCGGAPSKATSPDIAATHFASAAFTIFEKPAGSAADFTTIDSVRAFFIPDVDGTYRIAMVGTDNQGRSDGDTLVVNVAKYVGVGGIVGSAMPPDCSICHGGIAATWRQTPHATALQRKLDDADTANSHFKQSYCVPCHATGSTNPDADDDGWQSRARTLGWTFPATIGPGTFEALKNGYPELAKMAGVQCESCHGPGSAHNGVKTDNKIAVTMTSQQCNQCHDAPPYHNTIDEYENSGHSHSTDEPGVPEYMNRGSQTNRDSDCARCHTSNGYVDVFFKSSDPTKAFTKAPYKDVGYVGCVTCHDPHDASQPHQLRKPADQICADCHSIRVSGQSGLHSSHQGPMLEGTGGREFPGYTYESSAHRNVAEKCATCHMSAPSDPQYKNLLGGHSFRVRYDKGTSDPTDDVINETGCITCHAGGMTLADVDETQNEIKDLLAQVKALLPLRTDGRPKFPSDTTMTQTQRDASWNYYYVNNDNSFGVHNFKYAKSLLTATLAVLNATDVEKVGAAGNWELSQNYPNPFNPSTDIRFSIPRGTQVRLVVYDAQGREVSVLINSHLGAGTYVVRWNGTGTEARTVPSGLYFYRIEAGDFTSTRKMMLMK